MKTLTIQITDEDHARLAAFADVLGITVEQYIETEGMDWLVEGMECTAADNLASRIWDTLEEAQTATVKADALENTAYLWHFFQMADGRVLVESSGHDRERVESLGHVFVACGLSADWKEAA